MAIAETKFPTEILLIAHIFFLCVTKQVQIIQSRGYPVEINTVVTEDGYILEVHRIPHGKGQLTNANIPLGKPVFIQHGLGTSDIDWVISPSDRNLGREMLLIYYFNKLYAIEIDFINDRLIISSFSPC